MGYAHLRRKRVFATPAKIDTCENMLTKLALVNYLVLTVPFTRSLRISLLVHGAPELINQRPGKEWIMVS